MYSDIEEFDSNKEEHRILARQLPFGYVSTLPFLDYSAYVLNRGGERLFVWQDERFMHEFPSIFMPASRKLWTNASVIYASAEDLTKLEKERIMFMRKEMYGTEYYYRTEKFTTQIVNGFGKKLRSFLSKHPSPRVLHAYPKQKIQEFYAAWTKQLKTAAVLPGMEDDHAFFAHCLENLDRYGIRQVYVEIDGRLAGFSWGVMHPSGNWVGLHLKADRALRGLSHFLVHERAKMFEGVPLFTIGSDCNRPGLAAFKKELGPEKTIAYYRIATAGRYPRTAPETPASPSVPGTPPKAHSVSIPSPKTPPAPAPSPKVIPVQPKSSH